MAMRLLLLIGFLIMTVSTRSENIDWADQVEFQYNQFDGSNARFSARQALGPPDALPQGYINEKAFRLNDQSGFGTLILSYANPKIAQQIVIIENNCPGRIQSISLFDENEHQFKLFEKEPEPTSLRSRALLFKVPQENFKLKKIEININSISFPGWPQIDAVGVGNFQNKELFLTALKNHGEYTAVEEILFSDKKESVGSKVNSPYIDTKPIISPDGKTLYYARQHCPANVGGRNDDQDIYYSELINGEWTVAKNIGPPLNDKSANGVCSVSPDGNTLLVINSERNKKSPGVSISKRTSAGWSVPSCLNIKEFYNKSIYQDYFLGGNEKVLLMSIESKQTYGQQDLYISFKTGKNTFSAPINLGKTINTSENEFAPFLASDNKTLYFASEGHPGYGESDIYYTKRLDDTWTNWLPPKNIGKAVNSPTWDAYYSVSAAGDYAYFVSTNSVIKYFEDIYRIALPYEFKPEPVALISGAVLDAETNLPIEANISFENLITGDEEGIASSNPENAGQYSIVLTRGKKYAYRAISKGYIPQSECIDLTEMHEYQHVEKDLLLVPIKVGNVVKLNNLFFQRGTATLLENSYPELRNLLKILQINPKLVIELQGHTDNQGDASKNMELSQHRVEAIQNYLIKQGIPAYRLSTRGFGETKPVASNANPETRKLNRRVEIKIINN